MKLRLCIFTIECGLVAACITLQLDYKWMFTFLLLIHLSFLVHSGYTNLNMPTKEITSTTDFLVDHIDGGIVLNFFMGLALLFSKSLSFKLLGLGIIVSGIGFLFALRHVKEFRYQVMIVKQRPIPVVKQTTHLLEEVEV